MNQNSNEPNMIGGFALLIIIIFFTYSLRKKKPVADHSIGDNPPVSHSEIQKADPPKLQTSAHPPAPKDDKFKDENTICGMYRRGYSSKDIGKIIGYSIGEIVGILEKHRMIEAEPDETDYIPVAQKRTRRAHRELSYRA